ncbi:L-idonate 5-dehydrogenase [Rhizobiales bacterium]|uniref:L-idonate 5-dehydrogenase n=1 Tax=Hongsoonwoonella zoysiae TaxID=2821844 RepID=UPI00155FEE98|nr:L-idonate 5-dehydrogenase [Hongsoonwoonella zoysiae]NRG19115.1 L-idonate 5-dehydrogenase [Hongsoonwoonella zoysiae]
MKAIHVHAAGDLRLSEVQSTRTGPDEVRVKIARGGICGSDLHYYQYGGFGTVRLREPMILGHEVAGHIIEIGSDVRNLREGDLVAVSPSRPCKSCRFCLQGLPNQCLNMRFYGSAMPFPHIQGAFREELIATAEQCVPAEGLSPPEAAMAEPLSVCLHATRRAGEVLGKRVLITGCGPIGVLAVLAARRAGAAEIVVVDIEENPLRFALRAGADQAINTVEEAEALSSYSADKGYFDILMECSGAQAALAAGIGALRPRGVIVQLGLSGDMSLPMTQITAKELELRGSFRFHEEFAVAVDLMSKGLIDVKPLLTHTLPLASFKEAFDIASDRSRAMKVQLDFGA